MFIPFEILFNAMFLEEHIGTAKKIKIILNDSPHPNKGHLKDLQKKNKKPIYSLANLSKE